MENDKKVVVAMTITHTIAIVIALICITVFVIALLKPASDATQVAEQNVETTKEDEMATISIQGIGTVKLDPDYAKFTFTYESEAQDTDTARNECTSAILDAISILHDEFGIPTTDLATKSMRLYNKHYTKDGEDVNLGVASHTIEATIHDISKLGEIYDRLASINHINLSAIDTYAIGSKEAMSEARKLAIKDAISKIDDYAEAAGMEFNGIESISCDNGYGSYDNVFRNNITMAKMNYSGASPDSTQYFDSKIEITDRVNITATIK